MSDLKRFQTIVDDVWKIVFGTERRPEVTTLKHTDLSKFEGMMMDKKPKRARTKGRYKADDKSTKEINEAWVGGKAPTRVKTIGYKKREKNVKS